MLQRLFRQFALGDVLSRPEQAHNLARSVLHRVSDFPDRLHLAGSRQHAVFKLERLPTLSGFGVCLQDPRPVVGVNATQESLIHAAKRRLIDFENPVKLFRPPPRIGREVKPPTAQLGHPLRLCQVGFALAQRGLGLFVRHRASPCILPAWRELRQAAR